MYVCRALTIWIYSRYFVWSLFGPLWWCTEYLIADWIWFFGGLRKLGNHALLLAWRDSTPDRSLWWSFSVLVSVCVLNIWTDVKLLAGGRCVQSGTTSKRSYLIVWDTEPDQLCVPAQFLYFVWQAAKPGTAQPFGVFDVTTWHARLPQSGIWPYLFCVLAVRFLFLDLMYLELCGQVSVHDLDYTWDR